MYSNRLRSVCLSLALAALLGACTKKEEVATQEVATREVGDQTAVKDTDLPKECIEAEQAQRECTEAMAAGYERVGHPEAGKLLRDALPKELEQARARWRSAPDKQVLAQSCAMGRDTIRAQPQCHR
ncbi:hypothetical protein [Burkholderia sp. F1]|uniref:hypothetical protein n=1 Tax=Burkholderia sp. F1 TaxID=3366817 RepID=UPI003D70805E